MWIKDDLAYDTKEQMICKIIGDSLIFGGYWIMPMLPEDIFGVTVRAEDYLQPLTRTQLLALKLRGIEVGVKLPTGKF